MIRVYVDMVADLFHHGHVRFLERARTYGDYLIVGNMIMMCQGKTSGDAIETCQDLLGQLS